MINSNTGDTRSSSTPTPDATKDVKTAQTDEDQQKFDELIAQWTAMTFEESEVPTLVQKVISDKPEDLYYGLIGLRKVLSQEDDPPIQEVIDTGVVPRLIKLISPSSVKRVQLEAAWCLANLCSGTTEQIQSVIQNGAISAFISLLSSDDDEVVDQSIWGLGNIAGDSAKFRDLILEQNGTEAMVKVLAKTSNVNLKRNGAWALSNLCKGKPSPKFELVAKAIPLFCDYLTVETDTKVLSEVAWSLCDLTKENEGIQDLLSFNVVSKLIEFFAHPDAAIKVPSLRIIEDIISGTAEQAEVVLKEENFLPELFKLIEDPQKKIRREVLWILSNITAGTPITFEAIMGNPAYVEKIIHAAKNDCFEVKREAIWTLSNSTANCTPAQIIRILENDVFACLAGLLVEQNAKLLKVVLGGIFNCLKWGEEFSIKDESGTNKFVAEIEKMGGVEKIEALQTHPDFDVYQIALKILENYFVIEGEGEGEQ